ncbi:MAG TPA: UvrD-helicase domain-containing protein [Solirubrobacterales bacterium]|jgi:ATP-dependent exoDNAse (exonuclease V) beta subunit|nr:UvrD-helicase domain-containing protein [Solirubrobacterales bacterium]
MSERTLTPEQAAAIEVSGLDVLLEAGAGTGKTGVMVDRYCRLICEKGVSPDAILAFTFTDKAAAELRQRIRAELARRAGAGSERAAELLTAIGGAWVTTIHGFCNRLLAGHPVAAGIDPGFRVLDAPETTRAAREAFDEALRDFLEQPADGPQTSDMRTPGAHRPRESREELVAAYDIDGLRGIVAGVHAELRSRGEAEPRLPEPPPSDPVEAIARAIEAAGQALEELKETDPKRELVERALGRLSEPGPAPGLDELRALRTDSRAKPILPYREAIEAAISRTAEAGEGGEAYRHLAELLELFSARFEAAKERRAGIDFEDLQILAARLLERAEIGGAYRTRFSHLLVDEFQDTNRLQLRLIEALRGPRSELVVVGDEFQSIYGFRHADLDVFRRQRDLIVQRADAELMELSGNFRSRPELIAAVNLFGAALLGESYRPLRVGAPPPPVDGPQTSDMRTAAAHRPQESRVELLLTGRDGWDGDEIELEPAIDGHTPLNCLGEARSVAERLGELAEGGIDRGEMVVLLRAFTHLDAYEDSLERAGLQPYVVGGRGYWSQQQVSDVCALLAAIANPLDDQALFGALASPACGAAPDTLWLLRAAAGKRRHVWPALERAVGAGEAELDEPDRLVQIPATEIELLRGFVATIGSLRERGPRLSLAALIEAVTTETGYDLAVLMRPAGEARFANVRKLMRLAAEFESREGRDLRGLLDFLAARAESDAEAQAATAAEGHDGVRIMTVHNAKGLEFDVVAVPDLSRSLLAGARPPLLTLGREQPPRVGMQLRRLGSGAINLYAYAELCEEAKARDAEEGLRLFHVAATRARQRLILSGVVKPEPGRETKPSTPVVERLVEALGVERDADSSIVVPPPEPRPGLDASFGASQIAVRVNLPSPERAAQLRATRRDAAADRPLGEGPPPLVERRPPIVPSRPLSYTAISAYEECPYRFYMERVLGLSGAVGNSPRIAGIDAYGTGRDAAGAPSAREERTAQGAAVHALLEWSQANSWSEPSEELVRRHALAAGLNPDATEPATLLEPVRGWLGSALRERIASAARARAEVPILLGVGDTVLRGSIDLLVEREGEPPLVVDYKTDRLDGSGPEEHAARYETQRSIYALAVAKSLGAPEVEVAYVFLERPEEPVLSRLGPTEMEAGRERLAAAIGRIGRGEFPVAPPEQRSWSLCRGCPALGRLCSGPRSTDEGG